MDRLTWYQCIVRVSKDLVQFFLPIDIENYNYKVTVHGATNNTILGIRQDFTSWSSLEDYKETVERTDVCFQGHAPSIDKVNFMEYTEYNTEVIRYLLLSAQTICFEEDIVIFCNRELTRLSVGGSSCDSVLTAFSQLRFLLSSFVVGRRNQSEQFLRCLRTFSFSSIAELLVKSGVSAGWHIDDSSLCMCSYTTASIKEALTAVEGLITQFEFPTDDEARLFKVNEARLERCTRCLQKKYRLEMRLDADTMKLHVAFPSSTTRKKVVDCLISAVEASGVCEGFQVDIKLSRSECELLQKNDVAVFSQCVEQGYSQNSTEVKMDFFPENYSCVIQSKSYNLMYDTSEKLKLCLSNIENERLKPKTRGTTAWFKSTGCLQKLKDIDKLCYTNSVVTIFKKSTLYSDIEDERNHSIGWMFDNWPIMYHYQPVLHRIELVSRFSYIEQADGLMTCPGGTSSTHELSDIKSERLPPGLHRVTYKTKLMFYQLDPDLIKRNDTAYHANYIKQLIQRGLHAMRDLKNIVIAVVGIRKMGYPSIEVAEEIIGNALRFLCDNPSCQIRSVAILVPPKERKIHNTFEAVINKIKQGVEHPSDGNVEVIISALSAECLADAVSRFNKEAADALVSDNWWSSSLKSSVTSLPLQQVEDMDYIARLRNVDLKIDVESENLRMVGLRADVETVREKMESVMLSQYDQDAELLPPNWLKGLDFHEVVVNQCSDEYYEVLTEALTSLHSVLPNYDYEITEIVRVQNKDLRQQYEAYKSRVKRECEDYGFYDPIERMLWHGTSEATVRKICSTEFNRSFARSGNQHGGVYFMTTARKALTKVYKVGDVFSKIIMCKVLTGRFCRGTELTTGSSISTAKYHSTVDDVDHPRMYVVYNDAAAYPEYIITFSSKRPPTDKTETADGLHNAV